MEAKKVKIESLQALRGIAFMGVFLSHVGIPVFNNAGHWAVSVFFILSGFVLVNAYLAGDKIGKPTIKGNLFFSINKIKKLYSLHLITMFFSMIFWFRDYIYNDNKYTEAAVQLISNILLIQAWIPKKSVYLSLNMVAWYLSAMTFLYFLFPYIIRLLKNEKWNLRKSAISIGIMFVIQLLTGFASSLIHGNEFVNKEFCKWFVYIFPLYRAVDFFIGCNLGYFWLKRDKDNGLVKSSVFELCTLFIVTCSIKICNELGERWWTFTAIFTISSILLIYLFAYKNGIITKILTNRFFVRIGNISSIMYMTHSVVIRYVDYVARRTINLNAKMMVMIVAILSLGISLIMVWMWDELIKIKDNHNG